jgi:hypothetical protein
VIRQTLNVNNIPTLDQQVQRLKPITRRLLLSNLWRLPEAGELSFEMRLLFDLPNLLLSDRANLVVSARANLAVSARANLVVSARAYFVVSARANFGVSARACPG